MKRKTLIKWNINKMRPECCTTTNKSEYMESERRKKITKTYPNAMPSIYPHQIENEHRRHESVKVLHIS